MDEARHRAGQRALTTLWRCASPSLEATARSPCTLARLLSERGDEVRSLIRNPAHAGDIEATGAEPVVCDLEHAADEEVAAAVGDAEAVVFAAGAGPGSGPERKWTMDYGGAVKLIDGRQGQRCRPLRDGGQHGR